ncbi:GGDEF domain-containing protein [Chlorobium sp. N1]|uniref:GGDEF domain-containing protein n=1 Tax=Chlorobium sp. N1 TaxID=2491138 RepID=UPI00103CE927|nr:GGDEF domain-containing protein [Chlorobium sp. N1]TCD47390.1 GGDEF domain-containing protein [Chlorobium sp. N1]
MKDLLSHRKRSPLLVIILAGVIGILVVIAGTTGFILFQSRVLDEVEKKEECYFNLVEFKAKVGGAGMEHPETAATGPAERSLQLRTEERDRILRFMYDRLVGQMEEACLKHVPVIPVPTVANSELVGIQLDSAIERVKAEARESMERLVLFNHLFLFFILALLLTLNIVAGWVLHYNYRLTLIPLGQLVEQLKLVNRDIPESIHDTAEEMKKELTSSAHSRDITQITESIMNFCGDLEAKNKKLDEIFIKDEKTGLYNYRHFKEHLIIDVERAKRFHSRVSLAMIDIDHFKQYNDAHGHIAGDQVLEILAGIIREESRSSDIPSRFGGEEFAILFPRTDQETALEISERLRKIISATPVPHEHHQPSGQLTVSIGIASYPDDAPDWYTLINNADRALYEAKNRGRNSVVAYSSLNLQPGSADEA